MPCRKPCSDTEQGLLRNKLDKVLGASELTYQYSMGLGCPLIRTHMVTSCPSTTDWSLIVTYWRRKGNKNDYRKHFTQLAQLAHLSVLLDANSYTYKAFYIRGKVNLVFKEVYLSKVIPGMQEAAWTVCQYFALVLGHQNPCHPPEDWDTPHQM